MYQSPTQPKNPLHGITLKMMVEELEAKYGWAGLAGQIKIKCFIDKPSVNSSLKFLRATPWARQKVEDYYFWTFYRRDGTRK
jgi:uncharacterized protein (DUF2132 family)